MAFGLAHNGTRPGGMTRPGTRNASDYRTVRQDTTIRDLKVQSIRMDRRASRAAIRSEVADYQVGDGE